MVDEAVNKYNHPNIESQEINLFSFVCANRRMPENAESRPRPYERMNITGVKGLTEAQKATLKALGAIEL
jgi:hypothetical protein